jgi:hypothetical protein
LEALKGGSKLESILTSIKKMLGIMERYTIFDADIIMHINSVFATLTQLGVGPSEGFSIEDDDSTWSDFIPEGSKLESVKSYMYLKVRMLFDPPLTSSVLESMNRMASEYEWRLQVAADPVNSLLGEEENQNGSI